MYERYYGFKTRPFSKTPDPRFLFLSSSHEEALARMQYAVEEKEILMLTGEIGSGKTTLTRALMDLLGEKSRVALILNPRLQSLEFLRTVAKRLECAHIPESKTDLLDAIYLRLYEDFRAGITPVIIIEEAHLIPYKETFEEIRLLTNFQLDDQNLLTLILVGQPELRRKMALPALAPLRQRIGFFYHINPLDSGETKAYVEHRLKIAGRGSPLFTEKALYILHRYSRGIPRVINNLTTMALLEGLAREAKMIDESVVESAVKEIGLDGYR